MLAPVAKRMHCLDARLASSIKRKFSWLLLCGVAQLSRGTRQLDDPLFADAR